jgi:hypothetical protein
MFRTIEESRKCRSVYRRAGDGVLVREGNPNTTKPSNFNMERMDACLAGDPILKPRGLRGEKLRAWLIDTP